MDILLKLLLANRDIACGFGLNMQTHVWKKFWKEAALQLNAEGPPMKTVVEWKSVWYEKRKYLRNKYKMRKPSKKEETIYNLISAKNKIEKFKEIAAKEMLQGLSENSLDSPPLNNIDVKVAKLLECYDTIESTENSTNSVTANPPSKEDEKKISSSSLLENELVLQDKLFEHMIEIPSELKQHNIKIHSSLQEISQSFDHSNELKKNLLNETIRQNREMLKLRKIEMEEIIKMNRRLIEKDVKM